LRPESIRPFAKQPRSYFDKSALQELAESIRQVGQVVPVLVRELPAGGRHTHELIDGQRRWHACQMAGTDISAIVMAVESEAKQFLLSLAANFGRADHTPLEIVSAVARLREHGMGIASIAKVFGKSTAWVSQYAKLNTLHPEVLARLGHCLPEDQRINVSTAIRLSALPQSMQPKLASEIVRRGLGLNETTMMLRQQGVILGRGPTVRDDWMVLVARVRRLSPVFESYLKLGAKFIEKLIRSRRPAEQRDFLRAIDVLIGHLKSLRKIAAGAVVSDGVAVSEPKEGACRGMEERSAA